MRVNKISFDQYDKQRTFDGSYDRLSIKAKDLCAQQPSAPDCTPKQMATMDVAQMQAYVRAELPAGGFSIEKINDSEGHLWVMWLEPKTFGQLAAPTTSKSTGSAKNASATVFDVCPPSDAVVASKKPRCLYLRFRL